MSTILQPYIIEHELTMSQTHKEGDRRRFYGVDLHTWSLTSEQAQFLMQRISVAIDQCTDISNKEVYNGV